MNCSNKAFESKYFTLYEVAAGVYAAIENKEANTGSNAGFVDLGDKVIVFDTFLNLDAARDLRKAIEELTGKRAAYVVNSHYHADHIIGNQVFEGAELIASDMTRESMLSSGAKMIEEIQALDMNTLTELKDQIEKETDKITLMNLKNEYKFLSNIMRSDFNMTYPKTTFEGSITISGSEKQAKLIHYDIAHTKGDVILYLPKERTCFMGDLLFDKMHPWLGAGEPESFIKVIDNILTLDIDVFIPGHGKVAGRQELLLEKQYIEAILELAARKHAEGAEASDVTVEDMPEEYKSWDGLTFTWNMDFLIKRLKEKQ
ncbi:MAG: MBL fold metallo-hydrolase [Bacillota bacterium]